MLYFDLNHNVQFAENVAFCVWRAPRYFDILSTECLQSPEVAWRPLHDTLQTAVHMLRDTTRWNASLHDDPRMQANSVRVITTTVSQFDCFCKSDSDTNNCELRRPQLHWHRHRPLARGVITLFAQERGHFLPPGRESSATLTHSIHREDRGEMITAPPWHWTFRSGIYDNLFTCTGRPGLIQN